MLKLLTIATLVLAQACGSSMQDDEPIGDSDPGVADSSRRGRLDTSPAA